MEGNCVHKINQSILTALVHLWEYDCLHCISLCGVFNSQSTREKKGSICLALFLSPLLQATINRTSENRWLAKQFFAPENNTSICVGNILSCRIATFKRCNFCYESIHIHQQAEFYRSPFPKELDKHSQSQSLMIMTAKNSMDYHLILGNGFNQFPAKSDNDTTESITDLHFIFSS